MKWFVALCCVTVALHIHIAVVWIRPELLRHYPAEPIYTILFRAGRIFAVVAPALFLLAASAVGRWTDFGRAVAALASLFLLGLVAWSGREEYLRLVPYADRYSLRQLLAYVDRLLFCACAFALFAAFLAPLIAFGGQMETQARRQARSKQSRRS